MKKLINSIMLGVIGLPNWHDEADRFNYISFIIFLSIIFNIFRYVFFQYDLLIPYFIFSFIFFLYGLSILARRLNYLKMSKFFLFLTPIPIINIIFIIYLMFPNKK